jgi:hypothetical protein
VGYAAAVDALCREASRRTRYPSRDAVVLLQADFTDQPENLPELIKRFDGGADIVVAERPPTRRRTCRSPCDRCVASLRGRCVPSCPSPACAIPSDRSGSTAVSVIRDLIKERATPHCLQGEGLGGQRRSAAARAPHARRVETVELAPRYDVRSTLRHASAWSDACRCCVSLAARGRSVRAARA